MGLQLGANAVGMWIYFCSWSYDMLIAGASYFSYLDEHGPVSDFTIKIVQSQGFIGNVLLQSLQCSVAMWWFRDICYMTPLS